MHLIVGIDTGKTSAAVCLDLEGKLVYSGHKTFAGADWLIDVIGKAGIPSIIACDREPNDIVRKVCSSFNAVLFYPKKSITILEKREAAKPFGLKNPHERDACTAAVKAYNLHRNKLGQAGRLAKDMGAGSVDGIKAKIIEKYSINEAIFNKPANRR